MSKGPLPEYIDAARLFSTGAEISATVSVDRLQRFREYLFDGASNYETPEAQVRLEFDIDASGHKVVSGDLTIQVELECQRCLGPMKLELSVHPELVAVKSERDEKQLKGNLDTVVLRNNDGNLVLDVLDMVEDELILGLPLAPRHANDNCSDGFSALKSEAEPESGKRSLTADDPKLTAQLLALKAKLGKDKQDNG